MNFRDLPFRTKFVLLTSAICVFCVALCMFAFIRQERATLKNEFELHNRSIARMLAFNSSAVVTFREEDSGTELLLGLTDQPDVEGAALYATDGVRIATFQRDGVSLPESWDSSISFAKLESSSGSLIILEPIIEQGERVGVVYLKSSQDAMMKKLFGQFSAAIGVGAFALLATMLLSLFLQRFITAPILRLASTASKITEVGDYSVRVSPPGKDELGTLYTAFNKMLVRIDESEQRLKLYNDDLESSVQQRTIELQKEIKEHKKTERDLISSKEIAEAANKVKSDFLANMSHEIRTPMNAIIGFTDLMLEDRIDKQHREYMKMISSSSKHLLSLINDVLDISKIEAGRMEVSLTQASPQELVGGVVSIMSVKAQEKGIDLTYRWESKIPDEVQTDPDRFKQILINLVGNAIKFTTKGGVSIRLKVIDKQTTDPKLQVDVVDTGIGVPASQQQRIFEPFTQADYSVTRTFGGTGLGLAITRRLIDAMGGTLSVRSKEGVGSCFTFTLPTGSLDGIEFSPAESKSVVSTDTTMPPIVIPDDIHPDDKDKILLVEDGEINRRLVSLVLQRAGYEVETAVNGKIGFEMAMKKEYDAILMDMQMPVMDGYTATRHLREQSFTKPIIALTAHAMSGDREKCINAGCSDYLTKPVDADKLDAMIQQWIGASTDSISYV